MFLAKIDVGDRLACEARLRRQRCLEHRQSVGLEDAEVLEDTLFDLELLQTPQDVEIFRPALDQQDVAAEDDLVRFGQDAQQTLAK